MQIGLIGLGRMGANMARRLMRGGHRVVVYDRDPDRIQAVVDEGATGASSITDLARRLERPRAVWVMVPAGDATEQAITALGAALEGGDTVIDGGNSFFKDDVRRARMLAERHIRHLDAGTSGGVWGLERGYCLMVGGNRDAFAELEPVFRTLAPGRAGVAATPGRASATTAEEGYLHCGPSGSGHFVKMVHNGIEYGLMQAYAEGFDVLRNASSQALPEEIRYDLDLGAISELWRRGSVVASWLLDLAALALAGDPRLEGYTGHVEDSGEGRWTVQAAIEEAVPANVLSAALYARFRSRQSHTFAEKLLSALRYQFGGHVEPSDAGKGKGGAP
jgi:6-phosphogluconate dehydrogenase